jgi:subtilisin family serine protease
LPRIVFDVVDENGKPLPVRGRLHVQDADGETHVVNSIHGPADSVGRLIFLLRDDWTPKLLHFAAQAPGYWPNTVPAPAPGSQLRCERLPELPATGGGWWWHEVMNIATPDPQAGHRIKIGVIDTALDLGAGLDHVRLTTSNGAAVHAVAMPFPAHGEIVCRIIGQRANSSRCDGLAPAAQLFAVAADAPRGKLDFEKATAAVRYLALDCGVDLINISAGLFENPLLGLRSVIRQAARHGTLCIVAAGNEPRSALAFPARYPDCIGVGAIGLLGWGPASSTVRRFGERSAGPRGRVPEGPPVFHFPLSAFGEGLDLVAPGVGILVNRGAEPLFVASGTSYAAPMVCGLLAAALSRSEEYCDLPRNLDRAEKARAILQGLCVKTGLGPEYEGLGLPRAELRDGAMIPPH